MLLLHFTLKLSRLENIWVSLNPSVHLFLMRPIRFPVLASYTCKIQKNHTEVCEEEKHDIETIKDCSLLLHY